MPLGTHSPAGTITAERTAAGSSCRRTPRWAMEVDALIPGDPEQPGRRQRSTNRRIYRSAATVFLGESAQSNWVNRRKIPRFIPYELQ
jgi:hypothetical protein